MQVTDSTQSTRNCRPSRFTAAKKGNECLRAHHRKAMRGDRQMRSWVSLTEARLELRIGSTIAERGCQREGSENKKSEPTAHEQSPEWGQKERVNVPKSDTSSKTRCASEAPKYVKSAGSPVPFPRQLESSPGLEEFPVQRLYGGGHLVLVHDECQVDFRAAVRY